MWQGAGSAWAEVEAESVAGCKQCRDRDTGSTDSIHSLCWRQPCWECRGALPRVGTSSAGTGQPSKSSGLTLHRSSQPDRKDAALRSRRSGNTARGSQVSWDQELNRGMSPHAPLHCFLLLSLSPPVVSHHSPGEVGSTPVCQGCPVHNTQRWVGPADHPKAAFEGQEPNFSISVCY